MHKIATRAVVAFLFVVAATLLAAPAPRLADFVGTWNAKFNGTTFITLKLDLRMGALGGSITHGSIEADAEGNLTSAEAREGADEVKEAKIVGDHLEFTAKGSEEEDNHWQLKLVDATHAQLSLVAPPGLEVKLKPFAMERVGMRPAAPAAKK